MNLRGRHLFQALLCIVSIIKQGEMMECPEACLCLGPNLVCRGMDLNTLNFEINNFVFLDLRNNFLYSRFQIEEHWEPQNSPHLTKIDFSGTNDFNDGGLLCSVIADLKKVYPTVIIQPECSPPAPVHPTARPRPPGPSPDPHPTQDPLLDQWIAAVVGSCVGGGGFLTVIIVWIARRCKKAPGYQELQEVITRSESRINLIPGVGVHLSLGEDNIAGNSEGNQNDPPLPSSNPETNPGDDTSGATGGKMTTPEKKTEGKIIQ